MDKIVKLIVRHSYPSDYKVLRELVVSSTSRDYDRHIPDWDMPDWRGDIEIVLWECIKLDKAEFLNRIIEVYSFLCRKELCTKLKKLCNIRES